MEINRHFKKFATRSTAGFYGHYIVVQTKWFNGRSLSYQADSYCDAWLQIPLMVMQWQGNSCGVAILVPSSL